MAKLDMAISHNLPQDEAAKRIQTLPGSLIEAVEAAEESELVRNVLGEHFFQKFMVNKKIEWDVYRTHVTDYEIKRYLPLL